MELPLQEQARSVTGPSEDSGLVTSEAALDADLVARLGAVAEEEAAGEGRFESSRPILIESAVWLAVGALVWIVALLVWG